MNMLHIRYHLIFPKVHEISTIIISILSTRKLRLRKFKPLVKGHPASKWQNQDFTEGLFDTKSLLLTTIFW